MYAMHMVLYMGTLKRKKGMPPPPHSNASFQNHAWGGGGGLWSGQVAGHMTTPGGGDFQVMDSNIRLHDIQSPVQDLGF